MAPLPHQGRMSERDRKADCVGHYVHQLYWKETGRQCQQKEHVQHSTEYSHTLLTTTGRIAYLVNYLLLLVCSDILTQVIDIFCLLGYQYMKT